VTTIRWTFRFAVSHLIRSCNNFAPLSLNSPSSYSCRKPANDRGERTIAHPTHSLPLPLVLLFARYRPTASVFTIKSLPPRLTVNRLPSFAKPSTSFFHITSWLQKKRRPKACAISGSSLAKYHSRHSFARRGYRTVKLYATSGVCSRKVTGPMSSADATFGRKIWSVMMNGLMMLPYEWLTNTKRS
jgi:hypothetical protein